MARILTCTWAPTALAVPQLTGKSRALGLAELHGPQLTERMLSPVQAAEALGIDYLLVAQRWWGSGQEIEGSSYDCLAMTAFYAAQTKRLRLITAIHPGFFPARSDCQMGCHARPADGRPLGGQCHLRLARGRVRHVRGRADRTRPALRPDERVCRDFARRLDPRGV